MSTERNKSGLPGEIRLTGVHNARDLGGYRGEGGRKVAPLRLIRSGALARATAEDVEILTKERRLSLVIDLRTEAERVQSPDPVIPGVREIFHPILDEQTVGLTYEKDKAGKDPLDSFIEHAASQENPGRYMTDLYRNLVADSHAQRQYGDFLSILLEAGEGAVLWHCSAGKDRAGLAAALLLTALGAERETVFRDYEMTNEFLREETDRLAAAVEERYHDEKAVRCARVLNSVDRQYLSGAFSAIDREYGGMDSYLENRLGFTRQKMGRLREKFLLP